MKRRLVLCLCLIGCLLAALPVLAQEGPRGNQLLFTLNDSVALWDAERGEYEILPDIDASEFSRTAWSWSPDGRYLLAHTSNPLETRVYDVEAQTWDERVLGGYAAWSPDGNRIVHVRPIENGAELLLYDWDSGENTVIYSVQGTERNPESLSELQWSPNNEAVFFIHYVWGLGGTTNYPNLLNLQTGEEYPLAGGWYESYDPVWSPDGNYLLLLIDPTPVWTNGGLLIDDNIVGDIYLFDTQTGEKQRVTLTPIQREGNIRWSEDGQTILYDITETKAVPLADVFTLPQVGEQDSLEASWVSREGALAIITTSPDETLQVWRGRGCGMLISDDEGNIVDDNWYSLNFNECSRIEVEVIGWRPLPPA